MATQIDAQERNLLVNRLVGYIEHHGSMAKNRDGELWVLEEYTQYGGEYGCEWRPLPATWQSVRNWLGY